MPKKLKSLALPTAAARWLKKQECLLVANSNTAQVLDQCYVDSADAWNKTVSVPDSGAVRSSVATLRLAHTARAGRTLARSHRTFCPTLMLTCRITFDQWMLPSLLKSMIGPQRASGISSPRSTTSRMRPQPYAHRALRIQPVAPSARHFAV